VDDRLGLFVRTAITVGVILDPPGNVPIFLALTRGGTAPSRRRAAWQASALAAGVILSFALFGDAVLRVLDIGLPALQVAGGLLLALVALQLLGPGREDDLAATHNLALVPLGTPLLAGPGAIAATMVAVRRAGDLPGVAVVVAALVVALGVTWLCLRFAGELARYVSENVTHVLSQIMGLLTAAIAVEFVADGIRGLIAAGPGAGLGPG
jgi:multiple antibiotic resistance protein